MNWLDIILAIPLLWGLYKGLSKGLIIEAASVVAFVLAVWIAVKFHNFLSGWMEASMGWKNAYLPVISFAILFLGVLLAVYGVAKLAERFVKAASLNFLNKLGGGIFGALKFGLLMSLLLFVLGAVEKNVQVIPPETKNNSLLYSPVRKIAPAIIPGLTESRLAAYADPVKSN